MWRLKILLWLLAYLLKKSAKSQVAFQQQIQTQPFSFTVATQGWGGRHYFLDEQGVRSQTRTAATQVQLIFPDAQTAWQVLTSKDRNAFMQAIQSQQMKVEGDYKVLLQLQSSMKYIKA